MDGAVLVSDDFTFLMALLQIQLWLVVLASIRVESRRIYCVTETSAGNNVSAVK
jgi:hypothetical protein